MAKFKGLSLWFANKIIKKWKTNNKINKEILWEIFNVKNIILNY